MSALFWDEDQLNNGQFSDLSFYKSYGFEISPFLIIKFIMVQV